MNRYDIFPMTVLAVLGATHGKTAKEEAQELLEQEEQLAKEEKCSQMKN